MLPADDQHRSQTENSYRSSRISSGSRSHISGVISGVQPETSTSRGVELPRGEGEGEDEDEAFARLDAVRQRVEQWLTDLRFEASVQIVPLPTVTRHCRALFSGSPSTNHYDDIVLALSPDAPTARPVGDAGLGVTAAAERRAGLHALHEEMQRHSSAADLVVVNMPLSSPLAELQQSAQQTATEFLEAADLLSDSFKRVLLVRGAGNSVVTAEG